MNFRISVVSWTGLATWCAEGGAQSTALSIPSFLVVSSASSCGKTGKPDDAAINTDIEAKMFSEPGTKAATVEAWSQGGEVTLIGQVLDDSARLAAYKIASQAKGVAKVNDQVTVPTA